MTDAIVIAAAALMVTATICWTALRAWRGWLDLKRLELARASGEGRDIGLRIEVAAVRERVKQLEAIASGIEL